MEIFFTVIPNKAFAFILPSTFWCLSCYQRGWNLLTWTFTESSHLQVLLLSGEGVGEALHRLRFVFCYFWLDGLCYFLNYRINLFQKTMGLIDLVHLSGQKEKQLCLIGFCLSISESELYVRNEPSVKWEHHENPSGSVAYPLENSQEATDGWARQTTVSKGSLLLLLWAKTWPVFESR